MPAERFIHKRLGHDDRVSQLTDLQARVWAFGYLLAADDYGVMRRSALPLQELNDALAGRPARVIEQCLDALVTAGLLASFQAGGRAYVCSLSWQDDQHIRYPRETVHPTPPPEILSQCTAETQELFRQRRRKTGHEVPPNDSGNVSEMVRENFRTTPEVLPSLPSAGARETANGYRLTATGKRQPANGNRQEAHDAQAGFERFWDAYPKRVGKGAARRAWQKLRPTADLTTQILDALEWQRHQDSWRKEGGQYVPNPAKWIADGRWQDEPSQTPRLSERTLGIIRAGEEFVK